MLESLRGFTSSIFEFNANLYWIIFTYLLIKGIWRIYSLNKESFKLSIFTKNLSITSGLLLLLGLLSANLPIFNFFSYYFLGLQRYGVESKTPLLFHKMCMNSKFHGEVYFLVPKQLVNFMVCAFYFYCFICIKTSNISPLHYIGIFASSLGLYFSDNRTAIVLIFLSTLFTFP